MSHWEFVKHCAVWLVVGAVMLCIPYSMAFGSSPNLVEEYQLAQSQAVAEGEIIDSGEDYEPADAGGGTYYWWGKVVYEHPVAGRVDAMISGSTPSPAAPPLGRVKVRYLLSDPKVVLVDGYYDGQTLLESSWPRSPSEYWRANWLRVSVLCALALGLAIVVVRYWWTDARKYLGSLRPPHSDHGST